MKYLTLAHFGDVLKSNASKARVDIFADENYIYEEYRQYPHDCYTIRVRSLYPTLIDVLLTPGVIIALLCVGGNETKTQIMPLLANGTLPVCEVQLYTVYFHMDLFRDLIISPQSNVRILSLWSGDDIAEQDIVSLLLHPSCRIQRVKGNFSNSIADINALLKKNWILKENRKVALVMLSKGITGRIGGLADLPSEMMTKIIQFI
jgi:hypothetical protein